MTKTKLTKLDLLSQLDHAKHEEQILSFWDEINAFERTVAERGSDNPYVFYDGPPFATGLPHYGHLLASTAKDVVPRYFTMKGFRVERTWGWDCHGIPIENMIEGELGLKGGKRGIEEYGIGNFNSACRAAILRFDKEWQKTIRRLGRWVDFDNSYKTMDKSFMESVWWAFGQMVKQDLVYEGRKVILYCPRCSTPLSNFEIAMDNSYKDVETHSLYVKFQLLDNPDEYFVAWTTTPWTLPGNVALALHPNAEYVLVDTEAGKLWLAAELAPSVVAPSPKILKKVKGRELVGKKYVPLYEYLPVKDKQAYVVCGADFVSLEEGTGIVHTAAIYGEDDYQLAQREDLPTIPMLDDQGKFLPFIEPLSGLFYKKGGEWVVNELSERELFYKKTTITHSSPFCYRCGTALFYNAVPAWFINIQKLKPSLVKENEKINWIPQHLKHGRFGKGLETAPDWNISRSRYWGTPMPIWKGEKSGKLRVVSSIAELQEWAVDPDKVQNLTDLHREFLDDIELYVDDKRQEKGKRIPDVFDCWVESGSMPFASVAYPQVDKEQFENRYPAEFIVEYIAQTRAWFYTLHVISVALFGKPSFLNALTTGTILAEDGTKMSKSKKNYPDPQLVIDKYGVDSLRLYLMSSQVMKGENLNFAESSVDEIRKSVMNIWWNIFLFSQQLTESSEPDSTPHILDLWLSSRLESLTKLVTTKMDEYDLVTSSRALMAFAKEFSTWYLRLSRDRLKTNMASQKVFKDSLLKYSCLMAPFAPFMSERIYQFLGDLDSVHLANWPEYKASSHNPQLEADMQRVMQIVELGHAKRQESGIRLRQPLASANITVENGLSTDLVEVVQAELNLKQVSVKVGKELTVDLDVNLTQELIDEGTARDLMRDIQGARRRAGLSQREEVIVELTSWPANFEDAIKAKVNAKEIRQGKELKLIF